MTENKKTHKKMNEQVASAQHSEIVRGRGRMFEGTVTKKFQTRVVIEAERTVYHHKYERFFKKKMRMHARLPSGMDINVGDYVRAQECRPLSKIIHAVVVEKIRSAHHSQEAKQ